jgi:hypothetical protein
MYRTERVQQKPGRNKRRQGAVKEPIALEAKETPAIRSIDFCFAHSSANLQSA